MVVNEWLRFLKTVPPEIWGIFVLAVLGMSVSSFQTNHSSGEVVPNQTARLTSDKCTVPDSTEQVKKDIRIIVGGNFTPDALGPRYEKIERRVRRHPAEYLQAFEELFLGMRFDAMAQSELHLPRFLKEVREGAPQEVRERVKEVAAWLLKRYEAVLLIYDEAESGQVVLSLVPDETARLVQRLNERRDALCLLAEKSAC